MFTIPQLAVLFMVATLGHGMALIWYLRKEQMENL